MVDNIYATNIGFRLDCNIANAENQRQILCGMRNILPSFLVLEADAFCPGVSTFLFLAFDFGNGDFSGVCFFLGLFCLLRAVLEALRAVLEANVFCPGVSSFLFLLVDFDNEDFSGVCFFLGILLAVNEEQIIFQH